MTHTKPTLEIGQYIRGDIERVACAEPDPFEGWPEFAETNAHDMRSIRLDGALVGVMGYIPCGYLEVQSFAVIDRDAVKGMGGELARAMGKRVVQWMDDIGLVKAFADCPSNDRAAAVFLRAIGYRRIAGEDPTHTYFVITRG